MAGKQRKGAYIKDGELRVPKAAIRAAAAHAMKAGITKVNPATHKANLEANAEQLLKPAHGIEVPKERVRTAKATTTSRERSAAMDDWSHIKALEKDAAFEAIMDKGRSRKAKRAKAATKDDYAHIRNLANDAAYQREKRLRQKRDE